MARRGAWLAAAVVALATASPRAVGAEDRRPWTFVLYEAGDNDLEPEIVERLNAVAAAVTTDRVHVLAMVDLFDGKGGSIGGLPPFSGGRLLRFRPGAVDDVTGSSCGPGRDPEPDTSSPALLESVVERARVLAPSDRLCVVIDGHGDGPLGVATDANRAAGDSCPWPLRPRSPYLTFPEIALALADRAHAAGPVDLLVLDTCQSACLDGLLELSPSVRRVAAGQERVGVRSVDLPAVLRTLQADPEIGGRALGERFVRTYGGALDAPGPDGVGVFAVFDLQRSPELADRLAALGRAILAHLSTGDATARERTCATLLAPPRSWSDPACGGRDEIAVRLGLPPLGCGTYDASRVLEALGRHPDESVRSAAGSAAASLKAFVERRSAVSKVPTEAWCGASIHVPWLETTLDVRGLAIGPDHPWREARARLAEGTRHSARPPVVSDVAVVPEPDFPMLAWTVSATVGPSPTAVATAHLAFSYDGRSPFGMLPVRPAADGSLKASWDGRWFFLRGEGDGAVPIAPIKDPETLDVALDTLLARSVVRRNGEPTEIVFTTMPADKPRSRFPPHWVTWSIDWLDGVVPAGKSSARFDDGDEVTTGPGIDDVFPAGADGARRAPDWARATVRVRRGRSGEPPAIEWLPLPDLPSHVGFVVRGFDGRTAVSLVPLPKPTPPPK